MFPHIISRPAESCENLLKRTESRTIALLQEVKSCGETSKLLYFDKEAFNLTV